MSHNSVTKKIMNGNVILNGHPQLKEISGEVSVENSINLKLRQNVQNHQKDFSFYQG